MESRENLSVSTHTALLVIDAQVGLLDMAHHRDDVVARIADLIAKARAAGAPIIYVQPDSDEAGDLLEIGSPGRSTPALAAWFIRACSCAGDIRHALAACVL